MKKSICLAASLLALNLTPVFGQPTPPLPVQTQPRYAPPGVPPQPSDNFQQRLHEILNRANPPQNEAPALTKFNLDFPGGTPKELVAAIEKAMGKPLNVIIADEDASAKLPPIKVSELDIVRLFATLSKNGVKYSSPFSQNEIIRNYGFTTIDQTPSDNSLWTFYSYAKQTLQTQFSLDFPGGTPVRLVKAIEKAMGKPLNVIINKEDENIELPPLKMNDVYLPQLFAVLEAASRKVVAVSTGGFVGSYSEFSTGYGFKTDGQPFDNSVWYFHVEKPSLPPVVSIQKVCRFYQLAPYLERGLTVDDITTAIQTGWKMMGDTSTPEISFHKETKLLMAVGEPDKLEVIDNVLRALQPGLQNLNPTFQDRLKEIMKNSAPVAPPRFAPPPTQGSAAPALSPEAQVIAIEAERQRMQQSANPLLPAPLLPPAPKLPAEKSGK